MGLDLPFGHPSLLLYLRLSILSRHFLQMPQDIPLNQVPVLEFLILDDLLVSTRLDLSTLLFLLQQLHLSRWDAAFLMLGEDME